MTALRNHLVRGFQLGAALVGLLSPLHAQSFRLSLAASAAAPSAVGAPLHWTAVTVDDSADLQYRFRIRPAGADFQVVRDFSPVATLDWAAIRHEGLYEVEATARHARTGATAIATAWHQFTPLATTTPVITPTANPLVFLYSAPPCDPPARMHVEFVSPEGVVQSTLYQDCAAGLTMNFYLAGMRANTTYAVQHIVETSWTRVRSARVAGIEGPELFLTTGSIPISLPPVSILQPASSPTVDNVVLYSNLFGPSFATDLAGNVIWYYPASFTLLTRPEAGGRFLALTNNQAAAGFGQTLREIDVAGNILRETNTTQVNQQLAAMGQPTIGVFHHDALDLPNGGIAVLGTLEQIMTGVQGPGPVDIIGDMIIVLDPNLQVVWTWNSFSHLDPHRQATLGETCPGLGCPPITLAAHANDWLHGNALENTSDGNLLYSSRHQDWIIKIDFRGGQGTGNIIWRLGLGGDFQIQASDPSPWFSHQHGPEPSRENPGILAVFDDSNLRHSINPSANSRGQVLQVDEINRVATLLINTDLGGFSFAVGNAQPLRDGGYLFDVGWLPDNTCRPIELDSNGNQLSAMKLGGPQYRAFRMQNLYTLDSYQPPLPGSSRPAPLRGTLTEAP